MRVMLVEDHVPTREQIKALVSRESDLCVVAEVGAGDEVVGAARNAEPDVVVMDILLPGITGIEATRSLLADRPGTRVVVLSNHAGAAWVQAALQAGSHGYVRKHRAFEELVPAIRAVAAGGVYLGQGVN